MKFAYALLQRFGLLSEGKSVDTAYENRLDRLCQSEARRSNRGAAFRSPPSHPEV